MAITHAASQLKSSLVKKYLGNQPRAKQPHAENAHVG
jgi:hypothetical protein